MSFLFLICLGLVLVQIYPSRCVLLLLTYLLTYLAYAHFLCRKQNLI